MLTLQGRKGNYDIQSRACMSAWSEFQQWPLSHSSGGTAWHPAKLCFLMRKLQAPLEATDQVCLQRMIRFRDAGLTAFAFILAMNMQTIYSLEKQSLVSSFQGRSQSCKSKLPYILLLKISWRMGHSLVIAGKLSDLLYLFRRHGQAAYPQVSATSTLTFAVSDGLNS